MFLFHKGTHKPKVSAKKTLRLLRNLQLLGGGESENKSIQGERVNGIGYLIVIRYPSITWEVSLYSCVDLMCAFIV